MMFRCLVVGLVVSAVGTEALSPDFPPGWNGLAERPPLGWRSWNAFGAKISQADMEASIDALVSEIWTINGKTNQSLFSTGYISAGIDEGWEGCGDGVDGTQHDAQGNPTINSKFPDMASLVKYSHDRSMKIGWYQNGCACGERKALEINYEGDIRQLHNLGFDGVKFDGCGAQENMTLYAELMQATGKNFLIEDCHWGRCSSTDGSSCPTLDWCPFNWFRSSGDINSSPMSWLKNLQTTIQFQDLEAPLSRPGCWAYPDMLEVGRIMIDGKIDVPWNQAHFGAWCIVSSPLILGMDVTKHDDVAAVIDIITNAEAIEINQDWAGHPGGLIFERLVGARGFPVARACEPDNPELKQSGWSLKPLSNGNVALSTPEGGCLRVNGPGARGGAGGLIIADCNSTDPAQTFSWNASTLRLTQPSSGHCVDVHSSGPIVWMYGCSSGPNDQLHFNASDNTVSLNIGNGLCFGVEASDPAGFSYSSTLQAWAKPLSSAKGVALLFINPDTKPHDVQLPRYLLPLTGEGKNLTDVSVSVRDVWAHTDLAPIAKDAAVVGVTVPGMASVFLRLYAA